MQYFYFLLLIALAHSEKIISYSYRHEKLQRPKIKISFHDEDNTFYSYINTYLPFTLFDDRSFSHSIDSKKGKTLSLNYTGEYSCFEYTSNLYIDNNTIEGVPFYVSSKPISGSEQGIGLALKFDNESFSIVDNMNRNKMIEKKQFAFETRYTNLDTIHFGGIPNENELTFTYQGYINMNENTTSWKSTMKIIRYKNESNYINKECIFHTGYYDMIISKEVYEILKNILQEDIDNKDCFEAGYSEFQYIECYSDLPKLNEQIVFTIGDLILNITIRDLFIFYQDKWMSLVDSANNEHLDNVVILGYSFIRLFNVTIFDIEKKQIRLFTDSNIIQNIERNDTFFKQIVLISVGLICIIDMIILLINWLCTLNNNIKYNELSF